MNRPDNEVRRRLLSRSAFIFGIRALPALAILVVSIWFARQLPEALNGRYQQVWVYVAVFAAIGSAGIPALLITFSLKHIHRWARRLQGRHVFLFLLLNAGFALALSWLLRNTGVHPFILATMYLGQVVALLSETYLVLTDRFRLLLLLMICYTAVFIGLHLNFLHTGVGLNALFTGISMLLWARGGLQAGIAVSHYLRHRASVKPAGMPRNIRQQWLQLGLYDISQIIFRYIDKLLIGWLVGPASFAIYLYGTMDIPFLPLLLGAAGTALLRQLATTETGTEAKLAMMHFSGTALARIVFPIFSFLFIFRAEIIIGVFGPKYIAAVPLFAISVLAIPLRTYNFTAMLQHLHRVRLINLGALLDLLLALALAFPLFLWKGLAGVAVAFTICSYAQAAFYLYQTSRLLRRPVLDLIPATEWSILLLAYICAESAFRASFRSMTSERNALFLGVATTIVMIAGSLYPLISRRRNGPQDVPAKSSDAG